jgi:hypothetical protein
MSYDDSDIKQMEKDLAWWQVLETYIPEWRVFGWTYRRSASIDTGDSTISLTGGQRDQIVMALYKAEGRIK